MDKSNYDGLFDFEKPLQKINKYASIHSFNNDNVLVAGWEFTSTNASIYLERYNSYGEKLIEPFKLFTDTNGLSLVN